MEIKQNEPSEKMAAYRKISVTFWSDSFVQSLTPEGKYFYLYLMTNTRTTQCGIYEITKNQMCFEIGYNQETIEKLISQFEKTGKVKFSKQTNEIAIKNWPKYNESSSPKVLACVANELKLVKNRVLIEYLYSIDTESQETKAKAKEETKPEEGIERKIFDLFSNPSGLSITVMDTIVALVIHQQSFEKYMDGTFAHIWEQQKMSMGKPPISEYFKFANGNVFDNNQHLWKSFKRFWLDPKSNGQQPIKKNPGKL